MAPCINAGILVVLRGLEGYSLTESIEKMKKDWWVVYSRGLMVYYVCDLFNIQF